MKYVAPLFLAAVLCTSFLTSCIKKSEAPKNSHAIYDTALWMLKEFIIEGKDSNLGFSNFDELNDMNLREDQGIDLYYLIEDSLMNSTNPIDHYLLHMGRRIFPVYYHHQLRSAITFDTTVDGWRPSAFDDSNIIASYIADSNALGDPTVSHGAILSPSIHNHIIFRRTKTGSFILPTQELRREMAEHYPQGLNNAELSPVPSDDFFRGLKEHVKKVHKNRKPKRAKVQIHSS